MLETIVARLLRNCDRESKMDRILGILQQEFEQIHTDLSLARRVLKERPEELAEAIREAAETLSKGNEASA